VTVADLLPHIENLSRFLLAAGAEKVAEELDHVRGRLKPFAGLGLKAFADFQEKAGRTKGDPDEAAGRLVALYERAADPSVTREEIEAAVKALEALTKPKLDELARRLQIEHKLRTKADAIKAIGQAVLYRKGAFVRAES
jgi:hypothetical protein